VSFLNRIDRKACDNSKIDWIFPINLRKRGKKVYLRKKIYILESSCSEDPIFPNGKGDTTE
jgi:hypothetical protein